MSMTLEERVRGVYTQLSPQERRAADALLDAGDDLAVFTSGELADRSGVSRATLSRLYRRLGYDSFADVREQARTLRASGAPVPPEVPSGGSEFLEMESRNLAAVTRLLDGRLQQAAATIMDAATVTVWGERNSYPVALHLREQLVQLRRDVAVLPAPGQTLGEDLVGLGPTDVVVAVGLRRRVSEFSRVLAWCREERAQVVLIGDPSARRFAAAASHWLECPVDSPGQFASYSAAMALVALLANECGHVAGRDAQRRVTEIQQANLQLDELEPR